MHTQIHRRTHMRQQQFSLEKYEIESRSNRIELRVSYCTPRKFPVFKYLQCKNDDFYRSTFFVLLHLFYLIIFNCFLLMLSFHSSMYEFIYMIFTLRFTFDATNAYPIISSFSFARVLALSLSFSLGSDTFHLVFLLLLIKYSPDSRVFYSLKYYNFMPILYKRHKFTIDFTFFSVSKTKMYMYLYIKKNLNRTETPLLFYRTPSTLQIK